MKAILLNLLVIFSLSALAQSAYRDVVYLKNGSIIKGQVIEQIPNVSLKIETADGSILVYRMDEVEKMSKEKYDIPQANPQAAFSKEAENATITYFQRLIQTEGQGDFVYAAFEKTNGVSNGVNYTLMFNLYMDVKRGIWFNHPEEFEKGSLLHATTPASNNIMGQTMLAVGSLQGFPLHYVKGKRINFSGEASILQTENGPIVKSHNFTRFTKTDDLNAIDPLSPEEIKAAEEASKAAKVAEKEKAIRDSIFMIPIIGVWEGYSFSPDGTKKYPYKITILDGKNGTIWSEVPKKSSYCLIRTRVSVQNDKLICEGFQFIEKLELGGVRFGLGSLNLKYENNNGQKLIGRWHSENLEGDVIVSKSK